MVSRKAAKLAKILVYIKALGVFAPLREAYYFYAHYEHCSKGVLPMNESEITVYGNH
jgi:hypothetical protein